jgi:hypothetical protein
MFYRKVKKFCFILSFFIWIVIKYDWCDIKTIKKLECFLFDFFERNKKKKRESWEWFVKQAQHFSL